MLPRRGVPRHERREEDNDKRVIANTAYLQRMSAIHSRMLLIGLKGTGRQRAVPIKGGESSFSRRDPLMSLPG